MDRRGLVPDCSPLTRRIIYALILASSVCALYAQASGFSYLRLDDWGYTAGCPFVSGGLSLANICEAFTRFRYGGMWMPLTYISYAADLAIFGASWHAHHAVNILIHAANAVLAFFFIRMLVRRYDAWGDFACFAFVLFWAVHPQRVEAVAWIAARKDLLWTGLALAAFICTLRGRMAGALLACTGACLSKPSAMCVPALVLLICWREKRLCGIRKILPWLVPMLIVACFAAITAIRAQSNPEGMMPTPRAVDDTFYSRLFSAFSSVGLYAANLVWPREVYFDYMSIANGWWLAIAAAAVVAALFWRCRSWRGDIAFAALFFFVAIAPVSGIAGNYGDNPRADRFIYLASLAASFIFASALAAIENRTMRRCAAVGALMLSFACAAVAAIVTASYRNDVSAFTRTLAFEPDHWRALQHLGSEYAGRLGRTDEGVDMLRLSMRISPRDSTAELLAYVLACRGEKNDAPEIIRLCRKAAKHPQLDRRGMMAESLGIVAMWQSRPHDALKYFKASIAAPDRFYKSDEAKFRLADAYREIGENENALAILRALALSDDKSTRRRALEAAEKIFFAAEAGDLEL